MNEIIYENVLQEVCKLKIKLEQQGVKPTVLYIGFKKYNELKLDLKKFLNHSTTTDVTKIFGLFVIKVSDADYLSIE